MSSALFLKLPHNEGVLPHFGAHKFEAMPCVVSGLAQSRTSHYFANSYLHNIGHIADILVEWQFYFCEWQALGAESADVLFRCSGVSTVYLERYQ